MYILFRYMDPQGLFTGFDFRKRKALGCVDTTRRYCLSKAPNDLGRRRSWEQQCPLYTGRCDHRTLFDIDCP